MGYRAIPFEKPLGLIQLQGKGFDWYSVAGYRTQAFSLGALLRLGESSGSEEQGMGFRSSCRHCLVGLFKGEGREIVKAPQARAAFATWTPCASATLPGCRQALGTLQGCRF